MKNTLTIQCFKGQEVLPFIPDLARLRIDVFHDYPYLYEGNMESETRYLTSYVDCSESIIVLAFDGNKIVGASTALPLQFEMMECQKPFLENDLAVQDYFYLGESVLLPAYRGNGIYPAFFREREKAARESGCRYTTFCGVQRAADDARKPKDYQPLDEIWKRYGYEKHPELLGHFSWREIGETTESLKPMVFWIKALG